ncbi:MAG: MtnX-like HAD-IB family phosphatase [Candidatus Ranarchaeia archaeon]|jgi:2,3-diketo-5-methylthio-1-phosphopentane phosphatase
MTTNTNFYVVSDFDQTITDKDAAFMILDHFGDPVWRDIEQLYLERRIGSQEALERQFETVSATKKEMLDYIDVEVKIDPTFPSFVQTLQKKKIPFVISSEGLSFYITHLLDQYGVEGVPVYANEVKWGKDGKLGSGKLLFPYAKPPNIHYEPCRGECGDCKTHLLEKIRKSHQDFKIVFIGDGETDLCPMEFADIVFAKEGGPMLEYCRSHNIPCLPFRSFQDILTSPVFDFMNEKNK